MENKLKQGNVLDKQNLKSKLTRLKKEFKSFKHSIVYKHWNHYELSWYKNDIEVQITFIQSQLKSKLKA